MKAGLGAPVAGGLVPFMATLLTINDGHGVASDADGAARMSVWKGSLGRGSQKIRDMTPEAAGMVTI